MNNKARIAVTSALMMLSTIVFGQSNAGGSATIEPTMIIDKPTAGMLHRGNYYFSANFFEQGGVLGVDQGVTEMEILGELNEGHDCSSRPRRGARQSNTMKQGSAPCIGHLGKS